MTIKEIREISGLSQAKFSEKYGIPVRSLEDWESGRRKCPSYLLSLLERVVNQDRVEVSCYTPEILKELGYCYRGLLFVLNKRGNNPYPNSDTFPTKNFTMVHVKAVPLGIPNELNERISTLMWYIDPEDFAKSMSIPVPMELRMNYMMGIMEYDRDHDINYPMKI